MRYNKLVAFFVIIVLATSVLYPFSVTASNDASENSNKEEHAAVESYIDVKKHEENHGEDKKPEEQQSSGQNNSNTNITQTGPDEGDNRHPSGKDRSEEHGDSQDQGKSQSDPDGKENAYGGNSGKDKIGYDGGFDKGDQDGNNGCGNDDDFEDDNNGNCKGQSKVDNSQNPPQKNEGGCDKDGSTGDKNGRPCDPGGNNASNNGCLHGEPDCDEKGGTGGTGGKNDEPKKQDEKSPNVNISIATNININNQVSNQQSTQQNTSQVLAASTLAATGDYLFRVALALIIIGISSFIFGSFFLFKKAFNRVFNRGYQSYLYIYEA